RMVSGFQIGPIARQPVRNLAVDAVAEAYNPRRVIERINLAVAVRAGEIGHLSPQRGPVAVTFVDGDDTSHGRILLHYRIVSDLESLVRQSVACANQLSLNRYRVERGDRVHQDIGELRRRLVSSAQHLADAVTHPVERGISALTQGSILHRHP